MDEQPVTIKKRKTDDKLDIRENALKCVVHMPHATCSDDIKPVSEANIASIQRAAK